MRLCEMSEYAIMQSETGAKQKLIQYFQDSILIRNPIETEIASKRKPNSASRKYDLLLEAISRNGKTRNLFIS